MFFIGIFGTDAKVVPVGQIPEVSCPVCGRTVTFNVCRRYSYFHAFFIPLFKFGSIYLATCPSCASVFELDPELGKRLAHGEQISVGKENLRLLKSNLVPRCPACGAPQVEGSLFCNRCGAKL